MGADLTGRTQRTVLREKTDEVVCPEMPIGLGPMALLSRFSLDER